MKTRIVLALVALAGCTIAEAPSSTDDASDALTEPESTLSCPRFPAPADRTRKVVVAHPFGADPNRYEVLDLDRDGHLTRTSAMFSLGRGLDGTIAFTPDGSIGLVVQEGGTIGVFRFDAWGRVTVVDPGFAGGFYAGSITINPTGTRAYVTDADTAAHDGGVYELVIGCDGRLTSRGLVVPGGGANVLTFLPNSRRRAVLAGVKAFDSADGMDTFIVDLEQKSLVAQGDAFGDTPGIPSSMGITPDGKYALIADDSIKAGNRVAVVALPSMNATQILDTKAPFAIAMSPFDDSALIVNGDSCDEITTARYDATNVASPFTIGGPLAYTGAHPQLPGAVVQILRGPLRGRVLVSELVAVRQVQFGRGGRIDDLGPMTWEKSDDGMVGSIGVQP